MMDPEAVEKIKAALGTTTLRRTGYIASGCINQGEGYLIDNNRTVFIKSNKNEYAEVMFESEIASLKALGETNTVRVPQPLAPVLKAGPSGHKTWYCVLEFVEINELRVFSGQLGRQVAELHLHNEKILKGTSLHVSDFGFDTTTCVGLLPVTNSWNSDWPTFYTRRLEEQISRLKKFALPVLKQHEFDRLWFVLKPLIPRFFENIEVKPSLLHGDLWTGNVGETRTEPIIFDPGCVYGHHEFDLAMTTIFGRLDEQFYTAYHELIPKAPDFAAREPLYHLFHYLNHWSHFGMSYSGQTVSTMKRLVATTFPLT